MANIFLTRKCNLKCPYCFADEFVNKENEEMSFENFKKVIEFIKTNVNERVGLIGGEPTLHSQFSQIMDFLINDDEIKNFIIYTNGLELHKYMNYLSNEKVALLINCNSSKDIGDIMFNKLKHNITLLKDLNHKEYTLGINLYSKNFDYSYIFELLEIIGSHSLRFSTALPNSSKENTIDVLSGFKDFKDYLVGFFTECLKHEIIPCNDCNAIPNCVLDAEDKRILLQLNKLSKKYNVSSTIVTANTCRPVIDILPDLTAVRCFGLSKYMKRDIRDYKNIESLQRYFYNKIDLYAKLAFENKDCENCKTRLLDKCGVCFTYKLNKIGKLKEKVLEL